MALQVHFLNRKRARNLSLHSALHPSKQLRLRTKKWSLLPLWVGQWLMGKLQALHNNFKLKKHSIVKLTSLEVRLYGCTERKAKYPFQVRASNVYRVSKSPASSPLCLLLIIRSRKRSWGGSLAMRTKQKKSCWIRNRKLASAQGILILIHRRPVKV